MTDVSASATVSRASVAQQFKVLTLLTLYVTVSGVLIYWNKFLMAKDRFPHAAALTSCHMAASLVLCSLLYAVRPSLFPGVEATAGRRKEVLPWFLPLGSLFAVSLSMGNQAYFYCNIAFLQFMKEGSLVLNFALSCAVGLQVFGRVNVAV